MSRYFNRRTLAAALSIAAAIAAAFGVVALVDDDGDGRPDRVIVPLPAPASPDGGPERVVTDADQQLDSDEQHEAAEQGAGPGDHEDLRDEQPAGAPPDAPARVLDSTTTGIGPPEVVAGAQRISCRRNFVRNRSSRSGSGVRLFVLHYTVSSPGSLDAIRRLFDTPSFAASSHFGLEGSGRCEQWVPTSEKAWTQGAFNSVAESVEIIARGTEPRSWWLAQPIFKRGLLADLVRQRLRANGLPLRRVNPSGCGVQRAGWTDHNALECGNSHHDVTPAFPYDVLQRQIRAGDCGKRCQRARALRKRHRRAHAALRRADTPAERAAGRRSNRRVHLVAGRERIKL